MSEPTRVYHQFEDAKQQYDASILGIWLFLITEILFFGGLFLCYTVYRWMYPEAFSAGSTHLNLILGTVNTAVLISSSLTMALAVRASQLGERLKTVYFLASTIGLGLLFMGIKAVEYTSKFQEHLVPGPHFSFHGYEGPGIQLFYSLYFAMTGLHALHMVIGIILLTVLLIMSYRGSFSSGYYTPIEISGLYWHFVDIVWIFLFPLLYLIERHL